MQPITPNSLPSFFQPLKGSRGWEKVTLLPLPTPYGPP